jgi:hypothetical protein
MSGMVLLHKGLLVCDAPFCCGSGDFDAHGHAKGGDRVEAAHGGRGFGFLVGEAAGLQVCTDDRLEADHRGLGQRAFGIAGRRLPFLAADLSNATYRLASCGGVVFSPARQADRGGITGLASLARTAA